MKKASLYPFILLFICACSSAPEKSNEIRKDLKSLHKEICDDSSEVYNKYYKDIEKAVTISNIQSFKPDFIDENAAGLSLNFGTKSNVTEIMPVPEYFLGKGMDHMIFGNQISLFQLKTAMANPADSFCLYFGEEGRVNELTRLSNDVRSASESSEYIMVLSTKKVNLPKWLGKEYVAGAFEGKLVIFQMKDFKLIAALDIKAGSSESVSSSNFDDLGKAADDDFLKNIDQAVIDVLNENFKITEKPSALTFYKL